MDASRPDAVILFGHGSSLPDASEAMDEVARRLEAQFGYPRIVPAYLTLQRPNLEEAFADCVGAGAKHVVLLPYFLHEGEHVRQNIPDILRACAEQHPEVRRFPAVDEAVRQVATPIIRNNATIGGNLLQDTRCRFYDRSLFWRDAAGYCMKKPSPF